MAKYTTEQRRNMTKRNSSNYELPFATVDLNEEVDKNFDNNYAAKLKEDLPNNNIFRKINSELTGLPYEYAFLSGKYHPMLIEQQYSYKVHHRDEKTNEDIVETQYWWDSEVLQRSARLEENNEFHPNTNPYSDAILPIKPEKYSTWHSDTNENVIDWYPTETVLLNWISTLENWYYNGGGSGNFESSVYGEYFEYEAGLDDDLQKYMTVGYQEYQDGTSNDYMDENFNKDGEIIFIGTDDNFSFGIVKASKQQPARILFQQFSKKGEVANDSLITSTFNAGEQKIKYIAEYIIFYLKDYYESIIRYLDYNPNKTNADNQNTYDKTSDVLNLIKIWEEDTDRNDFTKMITLMNNIKAIRDSNYYTNRINYINTYLPTVSQLYNERFDIIDIRLKKVGGTLKELMDIKKGIVKAKSVMDEKEKSKEVQNNYFIVKWVLLDADWYERLFVKDDNGLNVGDVCYILTDEEETPEIETKITKIVDGYIFDSTKKYTEEDIRNKKKPPKVKVKKIFFEDIYIPNYYTIADGLRIVKEL